MHLRNIPGINSIQGIEMQKLTVALLKAEAKAFGKNEL
jgi:hypothetical protein